ncbi:MAG: YCF48-related protein [Chitinophagales bacterium]|nr:YCF48-related protein [Chitinophagales bacterium]MDW8426989.1 YCF48-related protein [Chitinophagales bacterium]
MRNFIIFLSLFWGLGCQEAEVELFFQELESPTTLTLNNIAAAGDSVVYACGGLRYDLGILLRSRDAGMSWQPVSTIDLRKELYGLWLFSKDTLVMANYDGLIYRSTDGGNTWVTNQPRLWDPVHDFHFYDARHGWACGGEAFRVGVLHFSTDGGANWIVDTFVAELRDVHFFSPERGVVAGYGLVMYTVDSGRTWQYSNAKGDFFVSLAFADDRVGFVAGYQGSIWKTQDGGHSWQRLRNGNSLVVPQLHFTRIAFRDRQNGYVIGPRGCFMKTTDGGYSWQRIAFPNTVDLYGIALTADGGFLCGSSGRLYRFYDP